MTPDLLNHIALIRAECQRVIEQGKAATDGPWKQTTGLAAEAGLDTMYSVEGPPSDFMYLRKPGDALFIATSRQFTPAAAEAVLVALDALEGIEKSNQWDVASTAETALLSLAAKFDYLWN